MGEGMEMHGEEGRKIPPSTGDDGTETAGYCNQRSATKGMPCSAAYVSAAEPAYPDIVKLTQPVKARSPMLVTLSEMETLVRPEQLRKARCPMLVTPDSIMTPIGDVPHGAVDLYL